MTHTTAQPRPGSGVDGFDETPAPTAYKLGSLCRMRALVSTPTGFDSLIRPYDTTVPIPSE